MATERGLGFGLSEADTAEVQRRVRGGETHVAAAAAVGCCAKTVQRLLRRTGGIKPRGRPRAPLRLSLAEREEISRGVPAKDSSRLIAERLSRAPSTVSRDIAANGGKHRYRAWRADDRARRLARRPKPAKLAGSARLRHEVERRLAERWSPQQIAARLVRDYPDDAEMRVSHETIYRSLFVQARGALRRELT
jgi:IS30 family transposase